MCKTQGTLETDRNQDTSVDNPIPAGGDMLNKLLQSKDGGNPWASTQYSTTGEVLLMLTN